MSLLNLFKFIHAAIIPGAGFAADLPCILSSSLPPFPIDVFVLTDSRNTPLQLSILPAKISGCSSPCFLSLVWHRVVSTEGNSDTSTALALLTKASPATRWDGTSPQTPRALLLLVMRHVLADGHAQGFLLFSCFELMSSQFIREFLLIAVIDY